MSSSSKRSTVKEKLPFSKNSVLDEKFFARDTRVVARDLIGKIFWVKQSRRFTAARITETEAYRGEDDPASHAGRGKTPRSSIMWGKPGRTYVYFIYGMYEMLNIVTEPEHTPGAVLVRAAEVISGLKSRNQRYQVRDLSGPGKLAKSLKIQMKDSGKPVWGPRFWITDDGVKPELIVETKRIGITKAAHLNWRYYWKDHPSVSRFE